MQGVPMIFRWAAIESSPHVYDRLQNPMWLRLILNDRKK